MKPITLAEVEYLTFKLAKEDSEFSELISAFRTRFPRVLESCLATPFQRFNKRDLYKGLIGKSAILFYLMIKNHPFQNGNKRIALATLLIFLYKNNKWFKVDNQELYNFTDWVAASPAELKDKVVESIEIFLKLHLLTLK
ncbi:MAG TPA: type II toxin-antitoxin system death-on-curing family toxin [Candidatus Paceibacterota bacterium]|nr:type II toxin-antitoxin system death-on-curing family toxin [Candidatus Paceibacterota bacterium]